MDALSPNPLSAAGLESTNWDSPEQVKAAFARVGVPLAATDDNTLGRVTHRWPRSCASTAAARSRPHVRARLGPENVRGGAVLPASGGSSGPSPGWMSCSDPNLQQIPAGGAPPLLRGPAPGTCWSKPTIHKSELRIAAKVADEAVMVAAYLEGRDSTR